MNKGNYKRYNLVRILILTVLFAVLGTGFAFAQKTSDQLLKEAQRETNVTRNYPAAIKLSRQGLAISPDYVDLRILLARLYILTSKRNEAIAELRNVLRRQPKNRDALGYMISANLTNRNYKASLAYANQFLKYYPADRNMIIKKVSILYLMRDYQSGSKEIARWVAKYPSDNRLKAAFADMRLGLAASYNKRGMWTSASREYKAVLALDPKNAEALQAMYKLSVRLKQNNAALQYAAQIKQNRLDPDIDLKRADLLKAINRYEEAEKIAARLKGQKPTDPDVIFLYKDIMFSQAKYQLSKGDTSAAIDSYKKVVSNHASDTTARNYLLNLQLAQDRYNDALNTIDTAIIYYDDQESILLKKLSIMQMASDTRETYDFAKTLKHTYPENNGIKDIYYDLWEETHQNRAGISYSNTSFTKVEREPWNVYSVFYMRKEKFGSVIGRLNYADRSDAKGYQFELEAYPAHRKGYSYIDLAYSDALVFPKIKAAYSYFLPLRKDDELEVGGRYTNADTDFISFTGAYGRFFNQYWLSLKTFVTPFDSKVATSFTLNGRYYLNDYWDDYITLIAGYGFAPDDRARNFEIRERLNLQSIRFTAGYQQTFFHRHIAGIFGTFNNQEFVPGRKRNELEIALSYQFKF